MSQSQNNNSSSNLNQEFKAPKDIEIKFFRLLPPKMNNKKTPLNGIYNDIDNIEEDKESSLQNKFSLFDLTSSVNIENIFSLEPFFG